MLQPREGSPAALGYRMPAEWEPHAATWLSWPHKEASWPGVFENIPGVWVEMVRALCLGERVNILTNSAAPAAHVRGLLEKGGVDLRSVHFYNVLTDDAWMRDHGPTFLVRDGEAGRELAMVHWRYNAWGGKYLPWENDARVPERLQSIIGCPRFEPGIVLEGGSIEVNGAGTVLTTESCLLNPNRNAHLSRSDIEQYLCDFLGVTNVLWLGDGIAGDDTDGHIDALTRFVDPTTVVTVVEANERDENFAVLRENRRRLKSMRDQDGRPLRIIDLPMPDPLYFDGQRLPASYANFYIGNRVVLVPVFRQPKDEQALAVLRDLFPGREVMGIDARAMVSGLGTFHCVTQQQPL